MNGLFVNAILFQIDFFVNIFSKFLFAGLVTFIAFIICGIVPLLVYMFVDVHSKSGDTNFYISIGMTAAALFILGALKVNLGKNTDNFRCEFFRLR